MFLLPQKKLFSTNQSSYEERVSVSVCINIYRELIIGTINLGKTCLAVPEYNSCCLLDTSNVTLHPKILRREKNPFDFMVASGLTSIIV